MNNKGFTLIEIMAVIAVLAVISLVTAPTIIKTYKKSNKTEYNEYVETLELAAESYVQNNLEKYPELGKPGGSININIKTLRDNGYVKKELINPKTKQNTSDNAGFKITVNNDGSYNYEFLDNN